MVGGPVLCVCVSVQDDNVFSSVHQRFSDQALSLVPLENISLDMDGLKSLLLVGAWKSLLDLSDTLATSASSFELMIQYKVIKVAAMMSLRMHGPALNEIETIKRVIEKEQSSNPNSKLGRQYLAHGLPFSLCFMRCQTIYLMGEDGRMENYFLLLQHCLDMAESLDQVSSNPEYMSYCKKELGDHYPPQQISEFVVPNDLSPQIWRNRADCLYITMASHHISRGAYSLALQLLSNILKRHPSNPDMLYMLFKLHIQMGHLEYGNRVLLRISDITGLDSIYTISCNGLMAMAQLNWPLALKCFECLHASYPANISAINNAAICHLYMGNAKGAIGTIEDLLFSDPFGNINEASILNACSIYDLISDRTVDNRKKMFQLVGDCAQDSFDLACIKFPGSLRGNERPTATSNLG